MGEQLTIDAVTAEAIDRVERNADRDWKADAYAAVERLARRRERFTSNDVLRVMEDTSEASTHELRAMGAVMQRAQRDGLIEATGEYVSSDRCHRYPKRVWRSRIVQGRVA